MRGNEFIKKIQALGKERGIKVELDVRHGKGSHSKLYFGSASTTVPNLRAEVKIGTLHAMLKHLGLTIKDISK